MITIFTSAIKTNRIYAGVVRIVSLVCLICILASSAACAQFCPICGTNPCREVARKQGRKAVEPPSPRLAPGDAMVAGSWAAKLLAGSTSELQGIKDAAYWKLFNYHPEALLNTLDQLSQSPSELKDPKTVESWAKAVQVDATVGMIKEVYMGTLGTIGSLGAQIISKSYSYSAPIQGGVPGKERVEQFFSILDGMTSELTGQPAQPKPSQKPPLCSPYAEIDTVEPIANDSPGSSIAVQQDAAQAARQIREKLLLGVVIGYNNAGLYYQAKQFRELAANRWGEVTDPDIRAKIDDELRTAGRQTQSNPIEHTGGDSADTPSRFPVSARSTAVVNFKVVALSDNQRYPNIFILCTPIGDGAPLADRFHLTLKPAGAGKMSVSLNNIHLPGTVTYYPSQFNAVKIELRAEEDMLRRGEAGVGGEAVVSINGQEVGSVRFPLPNRTRIFGPEGKVVVPSESDPTGFSIDCSIQSRSGGVTRFQFSSR